MPSDAKKRQAARKKEEAKLRLKKKPQNQAQQQQNGVGLDDDEQEFIRNEFLQNGHIPVVSETDEELKGDAGNRNGKGKEKVKKNLVKDLKGRKCCC